MPGGVASGLVTASGVQLTANPAAGQEISQTVPAGKSWLLLSVSVQLVQAATDTPQPILVIDDGTNVIFEAFGASAAQAVNTTVRYTWAPGLNLSGLVGSGANVHAVGPLPEDLYLKPGWRIRTVTLGLTSTGDYGAAALNIVEYGTV